MSDGFTPSCSSWVASVFGRRQWVMRGSAGRWPSGMAAIASATPVSHSSQPCAVLDQVAVVDEIHRLADVDARRPARNVAGDALAAIEDVESLDAGLGLRRGCQGRNYQRRHRCNADSRPLHNYPH